LIAKFYLQWLRLFRQLKLDLQEDTYIYCDNMQTISLLKKETPKLQTALRHVDIHQNWLRQEVQNNAIAVEWIPTASMPADGFTKMLPAQKHTQFIKQLGIQDIRERLETGSTSEKLNTKL
jgi:hypothetical protein